jgi:hypothetical protein
MQLRYNIYIYNYKYLILFIFSLILIKTAQVTDQKLGLYILWQRSLGSPGEISVPSVPQLLMRWKARACRNAEFLWEATCRVRTYLIFEQKLRPPICLSTPRIPPKTRVFEILPKFVKKGEKMLLAHAAVSLHGGIKGSTGW